MAIPEFLKRNSKNSKIQNFEYKVIWRIPKYQVLLPSWQLAKIMTISNFEIFVQNFQKKSEYPLYDKY
jgi:hypothetical protein